MTEQNERINTEKPWEELAEFLHRSDEEKVSAILKSFGSRELARTVLRLDLKDQNRLLGLLEPREAADVVREVGEELVADVMEDMSPDTAAAIVDELPSDEQADLLGEMGAAGGKRGHSGFWFESRITSDDSRDTSSGRQFRDVWFSVLRSGGCCVRAWAC